MPTLRAFRKLALLSMDEVAAAVHVKRQAVWEWENGLSQPRPANQRRLVEVLKITPAELLQALEETAKEARAKSEQEDVKERPAA